MNLSELRPAQQERIVKMIDEESFEIDKVGVLEEAEGELQKLAFNTTNLDESSRLFELAYMLKMIRMELKDVLESLKDEQDDGK